MRIEIRCVVDSKDQLGESPLWSDTEEVVYWVDNTKPALHCYDPKTAQHRTWMMPYEIGSIGLRSSGGFVAGMKKGFGFIDMPSGEPKPVVNPESHLVDHRMNDGKVDHRGRFWCGSMNVKFVENYQPTAALYRFDPDGSCHLIERDVIVNNGIAWSPDNRTMYRSDSSGKIVWAYDFDLDDGAVSNRRVFIDARNLPSNSGKVDGATIDTDGCYWAALVYDGLIARYTPAGKVDRVYRMPVSNPTMPTFGGRNLDVMYVTSATKMLNAWQRESQAMEGGLLEIRGLGVQGLPEPRFAG
jgi:L-arabinonolactonase